MKTCFFIGHRDAPEEIMPMLEAAVERHIQEYNVTTFIVGHYGEFDRMAANAVINAKREHEEIMLLDLMPYYDPKRSAYIRQGYNGMIYPFDQAPADNAAIPMANKYAVRACDYLIAYAYHEGNSRGIVEYAMRRQDKGKIQVLNLAHE